MHLLWVAIARHAATELSFIIPKTYPGQNDWFPRIWGNIFLTAIGCWNFSLFLKFILVGKNQFSQKLSDKNRWNFKHRNYLILSIEWYQSCCWVFCRLCTIIMRKFKKILHNYFRQIWPYGTKITSAVVISWSPQLAMRL